MPKLGKFFVPWLPALIVLLLAGCEAAQEEVKKAVKKVENAVATVPDLATQQANLTGSLTLEMDPQVELAAFSGKLEALGPNQPAVLYFSSSPPGQPETYPAVFFKAEAGTTKAAELQGQTLKAQMFVQRELQGTVFYTTPGEPLEVTVTEVKGRLVTLNLAGGKLNSTASREMVPVKGQMLGVLPANP